MDHSYARAANLSLNPCVKPLNNAIMRYTKPLTPSPTVAMIWFDLEMHDHLSGVESLSLIIEGKYRFRRVVCISECYMSVPSSKFASHDVKAAYQNREVLFAG